MEIIDRTGDDKVVVFVSMNSVNCKEYANLNKNVENLLFPN